MYRHNVKVMHTGKGFFLPAKAQPSSKTYCYSDFVPCNSCKGFFVKSDLRRHRCKFAEYEKPSVKAGQKLLKKEVWKLNETKASAAARSMLAKFKDDNITGAIKNDPVILDMLTLKGHRSLTREKWAGNQRYQVRLLGRFIIEARKLIPGAETLENILHAHHFEAIADAVENCRRSTNHIDGNETEETHQSSVPLALGKAIKKAAAQLKSMALKNCNDEQQKQAKKMMEIINDQWKDR